MKIERYLDGAVILNQGARNFVLRYESDPKLRKFSGWYISRVYDPKTLAWRDFPAPGWGETYWIGDDVAERLGLSTGGQNG